MTAPPDQAYGQDIRDRAFEFACQGKAAALASEANELAAIIGATVRNARRNLSQ